MLLLVALASSLKERDAVERGLWGSRICSNPGPKLAGPLPSNVTCTTPHAPNLLHHNYKR